jgi:hypothetical protein
LSERDRVSRVVVRGNDAAGPSVGQVIARRYLQPLRRVKLLEISKNP